MQFIQVKFNPGDETTYTYTHDGAEAVQAGDFVQVNGQWGKRSVEALQVSVTRPASVPDHIVLKPILGFTKAEAQA